MSQSGTAVANAADVLAADVLARIDRAAKGAAGTYRLARFGYAADDVAADVRAAIWSAAVLGQSVDTSAANVGRMAKRVADRIRRMAERETAADVVAELTAADGTASRADDGTRQHAAVLAKGAKVRPIKRTDVLAVAEWSREAMRAADDVYLSRERAARLLAELASDYVPQRASDRAAWNALAELAGTAEIPAHGTAESAEEWHGSHAADSAGYVLGRGRVFVCSAARPRASRQERAALRSAERAAVADMRNAEYAERAAVAMAESARGLLGTAVAVAMLTLSADVLAVATSATAEIRLERERAIRDRAAEIVPTFSAVTRAAVIPNSSAADQLMAAYRPEELAERVSAKRAERAANVGSHFAPDRNWLLATPRRVKWSAAIPGTATNTRAALQRAARDWAKHCLTAVASSFDVDAERSAYRAESAAILRGVVAEHAAEYVPIVPSRTGPYRVVNDHPSEHVETADELAARLELAAAYGAADWQWWHLASLAEMTIERAPRYYPAVNEWLGLRETVRPCRMMAREHVGPFIDSADVRPF